MKRLVPLSLCIVILLSLFSACNKAEEPLQPLSAAELLELGEKYLHELNYEQALVQFLIVIEVEPMNIRAYLGGTDAYLHLDRTQDAINWLNEGIDITDNKNLPLIIVGIEKSIVEGYIALAEAYEAEGWHEKALELLQRVYDETNDEIIGRKLGIVQASEIVFRDDYVINWIDPVFESLIRQYLGKESGDIHYDDVKLIEKIVIWGQFIAMPDESFQTSYSLDHFNIGNGREGSRDGEIKGLGDLKHFTSLRYLVVNFQADLDISALANVEGIDCLERLSLLDLTGDGLTDISVVSNLIALNSLSVMCNSISDISPISMLIELTNVSLGNNKNIVSAEPLMGLRKLSLINIDSADLSIFVPLKELKTLHIFGADDWSVLPLLHTIEYLEIAASDENFPYIIQLSALTHLRLHGDWYGSVMQTDGLTNISGIGMLSNLNRLDLLATNCHDISPLVSTNIENLELKLPYDCDLTPLIQMKNLQKIVVSENYHDYSENREPFSLVDELRTLLPNVEIVNDWR